MEKREMFPYFHLIVLVGVFSVCSFALANGIYGIIYRKVKSLENMCVSNEITNQMAVMSDLHCGYICHSEANSPSFSYDGTAGICTCNRGFVLKKRSCGADKIVSTFYTAEQTLGKPCPQPTDCKEQNATCTNGLCECNPGFEFFESERDCRLATIGKYCFSSVECLEQPSECREARCVCIQDHSYSLTEFACVPKHLGCGNYFISDPGLIPADHLTASSSYGTCNGPSSARLNTADAFPSSFPSCGSWASLYLDKLQYIQVNLNNVYLVRAVTTQGRDPRKFIQFVKSYKVLSSIDGFSFNPVLDHNGTKDMIFPGNMLGYENTTVTNELPCQIEAQYIRINPQEWYNHISLRFDVIGCTLYSADCDFANGTCGWQHEERSLIKWQLGQPNNIEGGPHKDHTCSTDVVACSYMYISSDQKENITARITVTIRRSNASRCFSLWHTASMNFSGSLNVITSKCEHGIEKLRKATTANFSENWSMTSVPVESGVYQIVIEGVWTDTSDGFLAIDDIKLNENVCP